MKTMNNRARAKLTAAGHAKPPSIVSRRTKPNWSVAPYVIALSQIDTLEQARWMAAMERRTENRDRRSSTRSGRLTEKAQSHRERAAERARRRKSAVLAVPR